MHSTSVRGARRSAVNPTAILAIVLISYFMIMLDNSVVFTGLPSIRAGLDLASTTLSWVQDAYIPVFGGLLLLGARSASLLIGIASTGWWIVAARALQDLGAAMIVAACHVLAKPNATPAASTPSGCLCATLGRCAVGVWC